MIERAGSQVLLDMKGIQKGFPGVQALKGVDLDVRAGEVHALVGENGAGKSTLVKIITGAEQRDEGEIVFKGEGLNRLSPRLARDLGIGVTYQEINLVRSLTVAENILFDRLPTRGIGFLDWRRLYQQTGELLGSLGIDINPTALVQDLSVGQQQLIEIARAASLASELIIMDEPTSSLSERETEVLFGLIDRLRARGTSIIYVSHRLDEVLQVADRITVLRDGEKVGTLDRVAATKELIIRMMVGRDISELYPKQEATIGDPVLEVKGLSQRGVLRDISLTLRSGEILGVFGLVGSGRTEAVRAIFGLDPKDSGVIWLGGRETQLATPMEAIRNRVGLAPEDRKLQGLVLPLGIRENIALPQLGALTRLGLMSVAKERSVARQMVQKLDVRTPSIEQKTLNLSGGNQQKVVIAKWLAMKPKVLILDEPTRGIDVATKAQVHALMSQLAQSGVGVLMVSSELPEILGMSDRILVFHQGRIAGEFSRAEATPELIMRCATGDTTLLEQASTES